MELFKDLLKALPNAATSPLAFVAYVLATTAWTVIALRVQRNKNLLNNLKNLPAQDRLPALRDEIGIVPLDRGLTPEQYLRSRIHFYYFLAFAILCITIIVLFVVIVQSKNNYPKTVRVYGKVFKSGDRRLGISNATTYLEQQSTRSMVTTGNGEFEFEIAESEVNKQATVWAKADGFQPSIPLTIIVRSEDKIFISLEPISQPISTNEPESLQNTKEIKKSDRLDSVPSSPESALPNCFHPDLDVTPRRLETQPGTLVRLSTSGVRGGQDFGRVTYKWTSSTGSIVSSGMSANLDTSGLRNCAIVSVEVIARTEDRNCVSSGRARILINDVLQPCQR